MGVSCCSGDEGDIRFQPAIAGSTRKGAASRREKGCNPARLFSSRNDQHIFRPGEGSCRWRSFRIRSFAPAGSCFARPHPALATAPAHPFSHTSSIPQQSLPYLAVSRFLAARHPVPLDKTKCTEVGMLRREAAACSENSGSARSLFSLSSSTFLHSPLDPLKIQ